MSNYFKQGRVPLQSQESDIHRLLDPTGNSESNFAGESINWQEAVHQGGDWQEQGPEDERGNWQQSAYDQFNEWKDSTTGDMDGNWQENPVNDWPQETSGNEGVEEDHPQETHEVWHENGMREAVENWLETPSDPSRMCRFIPVRRVNRFHPPDDDNVYSMELRELLSKRSVSNLLRSGFRESLDQLIQSYVERQTRAPIDWDLHRNLPTPTPASPEQDQEQQRDEQNGDQSDAMGRPSLVLPSPPVPPPQPLWHQDLHHTSWSRHSMHRSELVIIWKMPLQLGRVNSYFNRQIFCSYLKYVIWLAETSEDGSKWGHVRKGTCCVCCDSQIDSLLYRCGHMCTCSKCANELVHGGGKCPLCRAPIVEVIRAYSIL
ncbi:Protein neuralized [Camellia lanceoleosa]|uniref:Protein neuralized n=1 Tax=Camellia lanceoleosa TaxID=1840588 RepID=A0ACC0H5U6_9ERIC|nr:Protein neuralized [Camellia lanceoleosa]